MGASKTVGIVSDTHGLWRPEIVPVLAGVERILHAGDVGRREILFRLAEIAPLDAIRGNVDTDDDVAALPETFTETIHGRCVHMVHAIADLGADPRAAGWKVVIHGHSHKPGIVERDGVIFLNPGAAGPRRFRLPVTVALLTFGAGRPSAEIVPLPI